MLPYLGISLNMLKKRNIEFLFLYLGMRAILEKERETRGGEAE
jgi:hypothetical protein